MSKKKKWWKSGFSQAIFGNDDTAKKFPNTAKQHANKQKNLLDDEYYYDDDGYDDWGRELGFNQGKVKYTDSKKEYDSHYNTYEKTGHWGGYSYYKAPQLSYKYVCQMANALAGQHNITLKIGTTWEVDLLKKTLTYNPASLIYGTKSELLATLLHEIGKLRYMEHYTTLNSKYLAIYKESAAEALFPFEDVRVDYQMLRAYESAAELYESAIPGVQKQIELQKDYGQAFRKASIEIIRYAYNEIVNKTVSDPEEQKIKLLQTFGTTDIAKVQQRINEMSKYYQVNGSLFEYCADITHAMYDLETPTTGFENIKEKVDLTIPAIEPVKRELTSQGAVDIVETMVYPHIEDLMKDVNEKAEKLKEMFPGMIESIAKELEALFKQLMENSVGNAKKGAKAPTPNTGQGRENKIRGGGSAPTEDHIPPDWVAGDYKSLKESVDPEIKSLVQKLTFLRREEMTVKYEANQRRGKLNSRSLVKYAFGSRRLFKRKLPNVDTIQSFAFSVLMDISGSMSGRRIIHTTRAMVLFNEVFKKLNIPFELVVFGSDSKVIKSFETVPDKAMEIKIGGLVNASGGGTNIDRGLEALKIKNRTENNKIVVVLTDGGVGDASVYDNAYFTPWREKNNIKSIAFGLELNQRESDEMRRMVEGTGKVVESANTLPQEFAEVLRNVIKRKK